MRATEAMPPGSVQLWPFNLQIMVHGSAAHIIVLSDHRDNKPPIGQIVLRRLQLDFGVDWRFKKTLGPFMDSK